MFKLIEEGYLTKVFKDGVYLGRVYEANGGYYASRPQKMDEVFFNRMRNAIKFLIIVKEDDDNVSLQ